MLTSLRQKIGSNCKLQICNNLLSASESGISTYNEPSNNSLSLVPKTAVELILESQNALPIIFSRLSTGCYPNTEGLCLLFVEKAINLNQIFNFRLESAALFSLPLSNLNMTTGQHLDYTQQQSTRRIKDIEADSNVLQLTSMIMRCQILRSERVGNECIMNGGWAVSGTVWYL